MPSIFKTKEKEILDKITGSNQDNLDLICDLCKLMNLEKQDPTLGKKDVDDELNKPHSSLDDDRAEIYEAIQKLEAHNPPATEVINGLKKNLNCVVLVTIQQYLLDVDHKSANYVIRSTDLKNRDFLIDKKPYYFDGNLKIGGQRSTNSLGTGFFYKREEVVVIKKEGQEDIVEKRDRYFIITAAHVVYPPFMEITFSDLRFVGSYWVRNQNVNGLTKNAFDRGVSIPKEQVFKPIKNEPEYFKMSSNSHDFAIIEVIPENSANNFPDNIKDNALTEGDLFNFEAPDLTEEALLSRKVYGLGHGFGLPLKFSPCGDIINSDAQFLDCNLDFYTGNSGSPIFDSETHQLMGILLRGQRDVYFIGQSDALKPGVSDNGKGERCQKNTFIDNFEDMGLSEIDSVSHTDPKITTQDLLPYIHIQEGVGDALSLFICMTSENRAVNFEEEFNIFDDISEVRVKLSKRVESSIFKEKSYSNLSKNLGTTGEKTIEIRVHDQVSGLTHISVLNDESIHQISVEKSNQHLAGKFYWAACTPKEHFEEGKEDIIGFSVGYLNDNQFIRSSIVSISNTKQQELHFSIRAGHLELIDSPADFTVTVKKGILPYIAKPTSIGGRSGP